MLLASKKAAYPVILKNSFKFLRMKTLTKPEVLLAGTVIRCIFHLACLELGCVVHMGLHIAWLKVPARRPHS